MTDAERKFFMDYAVERSEEIARQMKEK